MDKLVIKFRQFSWTCIILGCLFQTLRCNNLSTGEKSFNELCRFEGLCLDCSDGGCEDMCQFYDNNCCVDESSANTLLQKWQYSCVREFPDMYDLHLDCRASPNGVYGVYMVTKCSKNWKDDNIKTKCEHSAEKDLLARIPVYDNIQEVVTYKNMFCAFCNMLTFERLSFWKFDLMCNDDIRTNGDFSETEYDPDQCFVRLVYQRHRMCAVDVIETCAGMEPLRSSDRTLCENGLTQTVYAWKYGHVFSVYKNEFCARCNHEKDELQCWAHQAFSCWPKELPPYSRVQAMVTFVMKGKLTSTDSISLFNNTCGVGVIYDPFKKTCTNITCSSIIDRCFSGKCRLVELPMSEFEIRNDSSLVYFDLNATIEVGQYYIKGSKIYVCLNKKQYIEYRAFLQTTLQTTGIDSSSSTKFPEQTLTSKASETRMTLFLLRLAMCICLYKSLSEV